MLMSMFLKLQVEQALHDNLPDRYSYACIHACRNYDRTRPYNKENLLWV